MSDEQDTTWDVALTKSTNQHNFPQMRVVLPTAIVRALNDAGMARAKLRITEDGILITPYVGTSKTSVTLPDWGKP